MKIVDPASFEKQGGLTIGIGAQNCLYTLRSEWNDTIGVSRGDGLAKESVVIRRSCHVRNLGKDWGEVAQRLSDILKESGYTDDVEVYVPGYCDGKLDPNKSPDPKYIPTEVIPFGIHQTKTITEVYASHPDYLINLAENYHPNEERARGRWMAFLRSELAPVLEARRAEREVKAKAAEIKRVDNKTRLKELAHVLKGASRQTGDFCDSMAKHFEEGGAVEDLHGRAPDIVAQVWAKSTGGRRGSEKYSAAMDEFYRRFMDPSPDVDALIDGLEKELTTPAAPQVNPARIDR